MWKSRKTISEHWKNFDIMAWNYDNSKQILSTQNRSIILLQNITFSLIIYTIHISLWDLRYLMNEIKFRTGSYVRFSGCDVWTYVLFILPELGTSRPVGFEKNQSKNNREEKKSKRENSPIENRYEMCIIFSLLLYFRSLTSSTRKERK